jgi:cell division protein FtsI (penicillin-binding protein 3)
VVYANNFLPMMKPNMVRDKIMPNVKGMGLKDALHLLENMGLKVVPRGSGKVTQQSLQAGTSITKGLTVYLDLG